MVRPPTARAEARHSGHLVLASLGVQLRTAGDQLGKDGDRLGVAEGGQALDPKRVEVVPREQGEVSVVAAEQAGLAVVEQVALADRLDHEGVLGRSGGGARAMAASKPKIGFGPGIDHVRGNRRLLRSAAALGEDARSPASAGESVSERGYYASSATCQATRSGAVDRRLVVGERDEPGLELGGRRVDATVEHRAAEAGVGLEVAGRGAGEVGGCLGGEEEGDQAGRRGDRERPAGGEAAQGRRRGARSARPSRA